MSAAPIDAALIDGHIHAYILPRDGFDAAPIDAALIDGHAIVMVASWTATAPHQSTRP